MSSKKKIPYKPLNTPSGQLFTSNKKHSYDLYKNTKKFPGLPSSSYNNLKLITKEAFSKQENKQFKKLNPNNFPKYNQIFTEITKKNSMPSKNRNDSQVVGSSNVKMKLSKMINQDLVSNNTTFHLLELSNINPNISSNKDNHFNQLNSLKKQSLKYNKQQNYSQRKIDLLANFEQSDTEKSTRKKSGVYNLKSSHDINEENCSCTKNKNKEDLSKIKIRINCDNFVTKNNFINGGNISKYPLTPKESGKIKILTTEGSLTKKLDICKRSNICSNNPPFELINNRNSFLFQAKNIMPSNKENSSLKDGFTISTINETKIKKGKISIDSNGSNNLCNGEKKMEMINNIPEDIHFFYVNMIQSGKSVEKRGIQGE